MDGKAPRPFMVPLDSREGRFTFVAVVVMLYTLGLFISVAVHEVIGHGLTTTLLGGEFYAVYISPGSGYASLFIPESVSANARAMIYMAGILVEIVLGCVLFFLILPRLKGFMTHLFGLVLSITLLVHPSIYLFLGFYYEGGDSFKAARTLGLSQSGDVFVVSGLILSGLFIILISMAALSFLSKHMKDIDGEGTKLLVLFWLPLIILGVTSAFVAAALLTSADMTYTLANTCILLLLIGAGIFLVPHIVEGDSEPRSYTFTGKDVMTVLICFILALALWVGAFGPTESSAHGLMLKHPPVAAEAYYSDYTIGNADLMVYNNGTVEVSIYLRNKLDNSSTPLDEKLYHSFDERPNWPYYVERARYMNLVMFGMTSEEARNLTFTTDMGLVNAMDETFQYGRICTTSFSFEFTDTGLIPGVRQPIDPSTGGGDDSTELLRFGFDDPWVLQGGYLDEVRISWDTNLTLTWYSASNIEETHILFNKGSLTEDTIGWNNIGYDTSPSTYEFIIRRGLEE